jgi:hypothetical protein
MVADVLFMGGRSFDALAAVSSKEGVLWDDMRAGG